MTDEELKRLQLTGLWLADHAPAENEAAALRFIRHAGFALRYNATASFISHGGQNFVMRV